MGKKSTAQPRPKLKVPPRGIGPVQEPNENDVLCGRGGRINAHEGNVQFRVIVNQRKKDYLAPTTKKLEKAHIAANLVDDIRTMNPPGRFLSQDPGGLWYDIGDAKAIKKVGQALREDAPEIREELDDDDSSGDDQQQMTPYNKSAVVTPATKSPAVAFSGRGGSHASARPSVVGHTIREDIPAYHTYDSYGAGPNGPQDPNAPFKSQRFPVAPGMQNIPTKLLNAGKRPANRGLDALDLNTSGGSKETQFVFGRPFTSPHSSSSTTVSSMSGVSADEHKLRNSGTSSSSSDRAKQQQHSSGSLDAAQIHPLTSLNKSVSLGSPEAAYRNSLRSSAIDAEMDEHDIRLSELSTAKPFDPRRSGRMDLDASRNNSMISTHSMDLDNFRHSLRSSQIDVDMLMRSSLRASNVDMEEAIRRSMLSQADTGVLFHDFSRSSQASYSTMDMRDSLRLSMLAGDFDPRSSTASDLTFNLSGLDHDGHGSGGGLDDLMQEGNTYTGIKGPVREGKSKGGVELSWENDSWGSHEGPASLGDEKATATTVFNSTSTADGGGAAAWPEAFDPTLRDEGFDARARTTSGASAMSFGTSVDLSGIRPRTTSGASAMSFGTTGELSSGSRSSVSILSNEMNTLDLKGKVESSQKK